MFPYLNELDQFVKHELKARHYVRYVDDFVLLHESPEQLRQWRDTIENFLRERLLLSLKKRSEPFSINEGVDFLGYVVRPHYRLVRRRVVRKLFVKLDAFARAHIRGDVLRLPPVARDQLHATLKSYFAHFHHAHTHKLRQRAVQQYAWLKTLYGEDKTTALIPAWQPRRVTGLVAQYRFFTRRFPDACVLMQVGQSWLTHGEFAHWLRAHGWGNPVQRPGLGACIEIHHRQRAALHRFLKRRHVTQVWAAQTGYLKTGFRRRALVAYVCPENPTSSFSFPRDAS